MTKNNLPVMTPEQRAAALEKARVVRLRRSELRASLATGGLKMSELLEMSESAAEKMRVAAAIKSMPGYGTEKTAKLMAELDIADNKRIGGLGPRQRAALVALFG